jgi:hypothetical protein
MLLSMYDNNNNDILLRASDHRVGRNPNACTLTSPTSTHGLVPPSCFPAALEWAVVISSIEREKAEGGTMDLPPLRSCPGPGPCSTAPLSGKE